MPSVGSINVEQHPSPSLLPLDVSMYEHVGEGSQSAGKWPVREWNTSAKPGANCVATEIFRGLRNEAQSVAFKTFSASARGSITVRESMGEAVNPHSS